MKALGRLLCGQKADDQHLSWHGGGERLWRPGNAPTETWAGRLTSGPNSKAAAAIERLEELRKTIKHLLARLKDWCRVATRYDRCAHILLSAVLLGTNPHLLVMRPEPRACFILPKPSVQEKFAGFRHYAT